MSSTFKNPEPVAAAVNVPQVPPARVDSIFRRRQMVMLPLLVLFTGFSFLLAVAIGAVTIPLDHLLGMLQAKFFPGSITPAWELGEELIIFQIRMPRVVGGMLVGAALATAGVIFQGLLRNPLADPYLIGTSAGAALGATIAMSLPATFLIIGFGTIPLFAFAGALLAVFTVYNVARVGAHTPVTSLLLTGFAISSFLTGIISFMMFMNPNLLRRIIVWMMGGISVSDWGQLAIITPLMALGVLAAYLRARDMNVMLLGEEQAAYLGINVDRQRVILLAVGALLTCTAVSISGLVGFVGLVVPHVTRLILGPDHRMLFPASALAGGCFLVLADLVARTVLAPVEIPVGIVTALFGSPFFIYLLRQNKKVYTF